MEGWLSNQGFVARKPTLYLRIMQFFIRFIGFFFGFRWHNARLRDNWHGDGDSFKVINSKGRAFDVRLKGIDCPEYSQPFGEEAGQMRKKLCGNVTFTVRTRGKDVYGRYLSKVILPDGRNLAMELLRAGLAHNEGLSWTAEFKAKRKKLGIWSLKERTESIPRHTANSRTPNLYPSPTHHARHNYYKSRSANIALGSSYRRSPFMDDGASPMRLTVIVPPIGRPTTKQIGEGWKHWVEGEYYALLRYKIQTEGILGWGF